MLNSASFLSFGFNSRPLNRSLIVLAGRLSKRPTAVTRSPTHWSGEYLIGFRFPVLVIIVQTSSTMIDKQENITSVKSFQQASKCFHNRVGFIVEMMNDV